MTDEEKQLAGATGHGVIFHENDQGFVSADYFDTTADLDAAWKRLTDENDKFISQEE